MNYTLTQFELDNKEATHCHLIKCVYIKGKGHVSRWFEFEFDKCFIFSVKYRYAPIPPRGLLLHSFLKISVSIKKALLLLS